MITMQDLDEAIAECQGQPRPNSNTCIKLAAYLIIKHLMFEDEQRVMNVQSNYSGASKPLEITDFDTGTPFSKKINGKPVSDVVALFDEVMETLQAINPPLYASIMRKI